MTGKPLMKKVTKMTEKPLIQKEVLSKAVRVGGELMAGGCKERE